MPVSGRVTLPISLASNRFKQQSFVLIFSEADCLLGLNFLDNNHCDAFFPTMHLRFLNSQTVPLFHNRIAPSDPCAEQFNVIARETTFVGAVREAVILNELPTQSFFEKSEGVLEPSPAFCERYH